MYGPILLHLYLYDTVRIGCNFYIVMYLKRNFNFSLEESYKIVKACYVYLTGLIKYLYSTFLPSFTFCTYKCVLNFYILLLAFFSCYSFNLF